MYLKDNIRYNLNSGSKMLFKFISQNLIKKNYLCNLLYKRLWIYKVEIKMPNNIFHF
jgi:hypothetical protein